MQKDFANTGTISVTGAGKGSSEQCHDDDKTILNIALRGDNMTKQEVLDSVDWEKVISAPRFAGGHTEVMLAIFGNKAVVIAEYFENDYQGTEAFAYRFSDGTIAILTDWFGSCPGCDSWEDSSDEDARNMIRSLVTSARIFSDLYQAIEFCTTVEDDAMEYPFHAARELVSQLKEQIKNKPQTYADLYNYAKDNGQ